jgi:hypothetical protein
MHGHTNIKFIKGLFKFVPYSPSDFLLLKTCELTNASFYRSEQQFYFIYLTSMLVLLSFRKLMGLRIWWKQRRPSIMCGSGR